MTTDDRKRCGNCSFFSPHQLNQRKGYCQTTPNASRLNGRGQRVVIGNW